MTPEEFKTFFQSAPERYPEVLEKQFPRILGKIQALWESPREAKACFWELVMDVRGNRAGFPPEAMTEILFLHRLHEKWFDERRRVAPSETLEALSRERGKLLAQARVAPTPDEQRVLNTVRGLAWAGKAQEALEAMRLAGFKVNMLDSAGQGLMAWAAQEGSAESIRRFAEQGVNPNTPDAHGSSPLHHAAQRGKIGAVEMLLYLGADPNLADMKRATPLILAASEPDERVARRLLDYGADHAELDNQGNSALHKAAEAGAAKTAWELLASGANRHARNARGETPLELAARSAETAAAFDRFARESLARNGQTSRR